MAKCKSCGVKIPEDKLYYQYVYDEQRKQERLFWYCEAHRNDEPGPGLKKILTSELERRIQNPEKLDDYLS
jgi:hypothetical protein